MGRPKELSKKTKVRDPYLDVMKGLAIFLVVVGHAVQSLPNYEHRIVFRVIYSFHIPLFMFLSGAVASYSSSPMNKKFLQKKFLILVVPFIAWATVNSVAHSLHGAHLHLFIAYMKRIIIFPDWGLWFLWVLFLNFCALAISKKLLPVFGRMSYLIIWLSVMLIPTNKYGIGLVKWHFPFFVTGYLLFKNKDKLITLAKPAFYVSLIMFPILIASWQWLYFPNFVTNLAPRLAAHNIAGVEVGDLATIHTYRIITLSYEYLVAFLGIGLACLLLPKLKNKFLYKPLEFLGLYTMEIYVLFWYFLDLGFGPFWINVAMRTLVSISLSILVATIILHRSKWLSFTFLGGRSGAKAGELAYQKVRRKLIPSLY